MRFLEITLIATLAIRISWPLFSHHLPKGAEMVSLAAGLVALLHLWLEGYRWHMLPLYALTLGLAIWSAVRLPGAPHDAFPRGRIPLALAGLLGLALCAALPIVFPIPQIPAPTGPYAVGTTSVHLTDAARTELWGADATAPREVMVQIWYPAEPASDAPMAPWMENAAIVSPAISAWIDMPAYFLDHLKYAYTDARAEAAVSGALEMYPVLIFSHGYGGFRAQNTFQMQELASYGYVVASLDHTYANVTTIFPDGRVVAHNPSTLPNDALSEEEYDRGANKLVRQWVEDIVFLLNTLESWQADDPQGLFTGKLDVTRVGVLGHSTGGGAAVEFCATDARCGAALIMDGWMVPVSKQVLTSGSDRPYLFFYSELWPKPRNMALFAEMFGHLSGDAFHLTIAGTDHYDFSDLPALSPLAPNLGLKGPLDGERVQTIINTYTIAFFNQYLKNEADDLLQGPSAVYSEVSFQTNR